MAILLSLWYKLTLLKNSNITYELIITSDISDTVVNKIRVEEKNTYIIWK